MACQQLVVLLLAGAVFAAAAAQQQKTLTGSARVVDGDTLWINGKDKVRIYGIDAPESKQQCKDAKGAEYACGAASTQALKAKIGNKPLSCTVKDVDQYGRNVAACSIKECATASSCTQTDLGQFQVSNGHATAYRAITKEYAVYEDKAKQQKKGVWAGTFQNPSQYRKSVKAAEGNPGQQQQQQRPQQQSVRPQAPPQKPQPLNSRPDQPATSSVGAGTRAKPSYAQMAQG